MPIHDWTRVDAGLFHDFHQDWTIELRRALNAGRLPPGFIALTDQQIGGPIPDVLTLHRGLKKPETSEPGGGLAVAAAPPKARFIECFKVGDRVKIIDSGFASGRIVELRGPLGPGGAQIYRVRGKPTPAYIEVREDLQLLPTGG